MIVAIHQPNFVPWLGYYHKIANADIFVYLDDVEFTKGGFINRNRIKLSNGSAGWLTIPVRISKTSRQKINEVVLFPPYHWKEKHLRSLITHYSRAPYFKRYFPLIEEVYMQDYSTLAQFNMTLSGVILKQLNIMTEIKISSELALDQKLKGTERLLEICLQLGGKVYLSGKGGKNYIDPSQFTAHNIQVIFQNFQHPTYPQLYGEFIPNLSILDVLFNCGPDTERFLKS